MRLKASWAGAKQMRGKRVGNYVREVKYCKDFGFILSEMGTIVGF